MRNATWPKSSGKGGNGAAHVAQMKRTWEGLRCLEVVIPTVDGMGRKDVSSSEEKGYQEVMMSF